MAAMCVDGDTDTVVGMVVASDAVCMVVAVAIAVVVVSVAAGGAVVVISGTHGWG